MSGERLKPTDNVNETTFADPEKPESPETPAQKLIVEGFEEIINGHNSGKRFPDEMSYDDVRYSTARLFAEYSPQDLRLVISRTVFPENEEPRTELVAKTGISEHDGGVMFDYNSEIGAESAARILFRVAEQMEKK